MAEIVFNGKTFNCAEQLPEKGTKALDFRLTANNFSIKSLADYEGKRIVMNIFPSIDTPVCMASVRKFNERANRLHNAVILCISADLPFAQKRFCGSENLNNVETLSSFRCNFGIDYGVQVVDGPMKGLLARSIIIISERGKIAYVQHVRELLHTPIDYDAVFEQL